MLQVQLLRELRFAAGAEPSHLSAASGLATLDGTAWVIADDELQLGAFAIDEPHAPGQLVRIVDGTLPSGGAERKAAKPDHESLLHLGPWRDHPHGALLALGSGSKAQRQRGALIPLSAVGLPLALAVPLDLAPLFAPLQAQFAELNIEGAFVLGERLVLLQRGNGNAGQHAAIELPLAAFVAWLAGDNAAPRPIGIRTFSLGELDGVPLGFTDGCALPDGGWMFSAAAEAGGSTYLDGDCTGSVIGRIDAAGTLAALQPLSLRTKVEGIALRLTAAGTQLLMVTDADDRAQPARLLSASLRAGPLAIDLA